MRNAILGKSLNILHQKMYGVNWCLNTTILAKSQSFPKRVEYLCRKAVTKKCKASMEAAAFSPPLKHLAKLFELFLNSYF